MIGLSELDLRILRIYLYGEAGLASVPDLLSADRIRRPLARDNRDRFVEIPLQSYMNRTTGAGRFATGNMFNIVNLFFSPYSNVNVSQPGANNQFSFLNLERAYELRPGRYSKAQLVAALGGIESYEFSMQQYAVGDTYDDRAARTLIYNSSVFALGEVTFVVAADGTRYIENYSVGPRYVKAADDGADNYDYGSGNIIAQLSSVYLQAATDPSEIGQTAYFDFVEPAPSTARYDLNAYLAEVQTSSTWTRHTAPSVSEITALVKDLFDDGVTRFLDAQDRPIIYGRPGDYDVSPDSLFFNVYSYLSEYAANGVVVIEVNGSDFLGGTLSNDHYIIAGTGDKTINGYFGDDTLPAPLKLPKLPSVLTFKALKEPSYDPLLIEF